jgi:hypothetical protein
LTKGKKYLILSSDVINLVLKLEEEEETASLSAAESIKTVMKRESPPLVRGEKE